MKKRNFLIYFLKRIIQFLLAYLLIVWSFLDAAPNLIFQNYSFANGGRDSKSKIQVSKHQKWKKAQQDYIQNLQRAFSQAESIYLEAYRILTNKNHPTQRSVFGKVNNAFQMELGLKIKNKSSFGCDQYKIKKSRVSSTVKNPPANPPQDLDFTHFEIFETCIARPNPQGFAFLQMKGPRQLEITYHNEQLRDILGLNTSTLGKKIHCQILLDQFFSLSVLNCENLAEDYEQTKLITFKTFQFRNQHQRMLVLDSEISEELQVLRKIHSEVPLEGKIVVYDEEVPPPPNSLPVPARTLPPPMSSSPDPSSPEPTSPPLLEKQRTRDPELVKVIKDRQKPKKPEEINPETPEGAVPPPLSQPENKEQSESGHPMADPQFVETSPEAPPPPDGDVWGGVLPERTPQSLKNKKSK